jgi:hypothetical protein
MKKAILIIVLFIGLGNVNAQSGATLEETKEWLEIYGSKLIQNPDNNFINYQLDFDGNKIMISYELTYDEIVYETTISDLKSVKSITYLPLSSDSGSGFSIIIRGGAGYWKNTKGDMVKESSNYILLRMITKKNATRVFNALKHLYTFYNNKVQFIDKVSIENKF